MFSIDKKVYLEDKQCFLYSLENIETLEIIKHYCTKDFSEGDIVNIVNEQIVFLEKETNNRKKDLSNRLSNLFKK